MNRIKKILPLLLLLISNKIWAQSYYMHEAARDASYRNDGGSFLGYLGLIVIIILLIIFIPLMISNKIDDSKFDKKYKNRKGVLTEEAKYILFEKRVKEYSNYRQKNEWTKWFIDGYIDGVGKHIIHCSTKELLENEWEKPAERHISSVREELTGGSRTISLLAYKDGYREGLKRRELKGNIELY